MKKTISTFALLPCVDVIDIIFVIFSSGVLSDAPSFFGETMGKFALMLLGTGVLFSLIVILLAIVDEYLHGHDS
ncbi:hypothetical protein C1K40_004449 [Salmonella enterica]|nr:hypothetical protein [Salmonella enterica]